jgi:hypothetical protein
VAREGVATPCRAVAEQPSGRRYAGRRLRVQRLTLPNECDVGGGARRSTYRFALSHGLVRRRVERIGELINTVNQPRRNDRVAAPRKALQGSG